MKAGILEGTNKISINEVPTPYITEDEIIIKVDSCGICGSDIRAIKNGNDRILAPYILGHEIAGHVVEIGKNQRLKFNIDDRIALSADIPCGNCKKCISGLENHCCNNIAFGHEYQGGFAEYLKLDKRVIDYGPLIVLPETDLTQNEISMSEPLACCINGYELCGHKEGYNVLIFGAGPIGCMLTKLYQSSNAKSVSLCDIDNERLQASATCKADRYLTFTKENLDSLNEELTENMGFDVIITACPSIEAQEASLNYSKPRGVINFFGGLPKDSKKASIDSNLLHYKEITILGSHGSTPKNHRDAVSMLLRKKITLQDLISKTFKLDDISTAVYEAINNKNNLKIIINP